MKITIKTAYNTQGKQYWFAENEQGETFGSSFFNSGFFESTTFVNFMYPDLESLKKDLETYKKSQKEPKEVESFEI